MKKMLALAFTAFALLALAACNTVPADSFAVPEDVVGFEAISATELLVHSLSGTVDVAQPLAFSLLEEEPLVEDDEETAVDDELAEVDQYLAMIEQFLGNENGLSVTVASSDLVEYAYKMTYVTKDLFGEDVTYVLYYNEVLYEEPVEDDDIITTTEEETTTEAETTTEEETTAEEETTTAEPLSFEDREHDEERLRDREFEFDDENDDEVKYALSGMLLIGDATYYLEGKKIVEDGEEVMMLRSYVDHDNFVKVRYQTEAGEKKFFFEVVTDGIIVNRSMVKVEFEENEVKVRLSFIEGEARGRYQFMLETEGNVTYIKVMYDTEDAEGVEESGNIRIEATYDELTGLTTYTYIVLPVKRGGENCEPQNHEFHMDRDNRRGSDKDNGGGKRDAA